MDFISVLTLMLAILTSVFTIKYIGPTFNRTEHIDVNNWMRKWILFFTWYGLVATIFVTTAVIGLFYTDNTFKNYIKKYISIVSTSK
jgi:uncharacterized membrane protein